MSSLLTNASALTALQSLDMTQSNLQTTQKQISTGLKVGSASDNAAYWSIAQSLQSDNGVLGAVNDSIAQSQSILGAATAAINNVITTIQSIKTVLSEAENPGADFAALNTSLQSLGQQLTNAVQGASYNGLNIINGSAASTLNFVSGYNVSSTGVATFNSIALTTQSLIGTGTTATTSSQPSITDTPTLTSITALTANGATLAYGSNVITTTAGTDPTVGPPFVAGTSGTVSIESQDLAGVITTTTYSAVDANGNAESTATLISTLGSATQGSLQVSVTTTPPKGLLTQGATNLTNITVATGTAATQMTDVNAALTAITKYSSILGSTSNSLTNASTFNASLQNNYTTGVGALVNADMNQASTRLQALQTQQQLGVQSLSIANQSSQLILKLFQ
jgi:flagellin